MNRMGGGKNIGTCPGLRKICKTRKKIEKKKGGGTREIWDNSRLEDEERKCSGRGGSRFGKLLPPAALKKKKGNRGKE